MSLPDALQGCTIVSSVPLSLNSAGDGDGPSPSGKGGELRPASTTASSPGSSIRLLNCVAVSQNCSSQNKQAGVCV